MSTFRANVTDRQQDVLENAAFEGGIPVHTDGEIRVVAEGNQTGTQRVSHSPVANTIGRNAGVVMPWSDVPGRFEDVTQGKA